MLFYIFLGFTILIFLILIAVVLFTFIRGIKNKKSWKEIFKILFKRVGVIVAIYIAVIFIVSLISDKQCSAKEEDIKAMKPQAEVITRYILENGVPESLAEIPNLPYKLERCEKEILYIKYGKIGAAYDYYDYHEDKDKEGANGKIIKEKCIFITHDQPYDISIRFSADYKQIYLDQMQDNDLNINIFNREILLVGNGNLTFFNKETETGMKYVYEFDKEKKIWVYKYFNIKGKRNNPQIYSTKDDGICNPMRM